MGKSGKNSILLVEIMIAVLFFALASTVILETFDTTRSQSRLAGTYNDALTEAQNVADVLYASEDFSGTLTAMGFSQTEDGWVRNAEDYAISVTYREESAVAGSLYAASVRGYQEERELFTLPLSWYVPREVVQ